ncbi:hypothetical protein GDO81_029265, partial [Engystomops pustulosus]
NRFVRALLSIFTCLSTCFYFVRKCKPSDTWDPELVPAAAPLNPLRSFLLPCLGCSLSSPPLSSGLLSMNVALRCLSRGGPCAASRTTWYLLPGKVLQYEGDEERDGVIYSVYLRNANSHQVTSLLYKVMDCEQCLMI